MRWAVFKDYRGVAYCEPVNEGINTYIKQIPARPEIRSFFGKIKQHGREAEIRRHIMFDELLYSRKDYVDSAFELPPEGFEFQDSIRYMVTNHWGPVDVLHFINSDEVGQRLQYALRRISPDPTLEIKDRIKDAQPHPDTDRIIESIRKVAE